MVLGSSLNPAPLIPNLSTPLLGVMGCVIHARRKGAVKYVKYIIPPLSMRSFFWGSCLVEVSNSWSSSARAVTI
jgi:hypothetical protein